MLIGFHNGVCTCRDEVLLVDTNFTAQGEVCPERYRSFWRNLLRQLNCSDNERSVRKLICMVQRYRKGDGWRIDQ